VTGVLAHVEATDRQVFLLQRKSIPVGRGLGKTTGWAHRMSLAKRGVQMINGLEYHKIDDKGLHISIDGQSQVLEVDTVIICAGQLPDRDLFDDLASFDIETSLVGGAFEAAELDAKAAINQSSHLVALV
jgi:2,4-dienoyl-CoA reductase (NADPH2)